MMKKFLIKALVLLCFWVHPFCWEREALAVDTSTYYQFSITGTDDPTVVPKAANKNAFYNRVGIGIYEKTDNGLSTNWSLIASASPFGVPTQISFFDAATGILTSPSGVDPDALTWDQVNGFFGIANSAPQSFIHALPSATSGTVSADATIFGYLHATSNVGGTAFVTGNANAVPGSIGASFGFNNWALGFVPFVTGNSNVAINASIAGGDQSEALAQDTVATGFNGVAFNIQDWAHSGRALGGSSHAESEGTAVGAGSYAQGFGSKTGSASELYACTLSGTTLTVPGIDVTADFAGRPDAYIFSLTGGTANTEFFSQQAIAGVVFGGVDTTMTLTTAISDRTNCEIIATVAGTGFNAHADSGGIAAGSGSHAQNGSTASGDNSHAEGVLTTASNVGAHSEGNTTVASGLHSHAEGGGTDATDTGAHAEGINSQATGEASHAEGDGSQATGDRSHAEGSATTASGLQAHAEGQSTTASGRACHAEGLTTSCTEVGAHAEGNLSQATAQYSHAGGTSSIAAGTNSFAHGVKAQTGANAGTFAISDSQNFTSSNTVADSFKARFQGGFKFVDGGGADDNDGVIDLDLNDTRALFPATVAVGGGAVATNSVLIAKDGHYKSTQTTAPTATPGVGAGTGATCALTNATDTAGIIVLNETGVLPVAGTQCTVTFDKAYNTAPICVVTPNNRRAANNASSLTQINYQTTTTTLIVDFGVAFAIAAEFRWMYNCVETQ